VHLFNVWNENQLMSLFYSYIAGSLHVSGRQAHLQESSYSCSHNHRFLQYLSALDACSVCCSLSWWLFSTGTPLTRLNIGEKLIRHMPHCIFYNILINLLKQSFNKTILKLEHDNSEHKGTVESHNIAVNKTRTLLFYCILFYNRIDQFCIT
jgi:hypothetical protein